MSDSDNRVARPDSARASAPGIVSPTYSTALTVTASAYVLLHHLGLLPGGLRAAPLGTRVVDWLDLLIPYLVLMPAAATLWAAAATARLWALFGVGAVTYASGHGIHLAANSIDRTSPGQAAHLWDEVVGHYIWYAGVALVTAAVVATMTGRGWPTHPGSYVLAVAVGVTWATNAIGGGTTLLSLLLAVAAVVYGWRHRSGLPVLLVVGYTPGAVLLVGELASVL